MTAFTVFFLQSLRPEVSSHEHEAVAEIVPGKRGCGRCFSILAVRDGVPESAYWLESRFREDNKITTISLFASGRGFRVHQTKEGGYATWSWGLSAIVATDTHAAEDFARAVLGRDYRGWVK